jgi:hypothetical protein
MRFGAFLESFRALEASRAASGGSDRRIAEHQDVRSGLTMRQRAGAFCIDPEHGSGVIAIFINSKPRRGLFGRGESPLSASAALCPARRRGSPKGIVVGGLVDNRGGRGTRALQGQC